MDKLQPKLVPEDKWFQLPPSRAFAVRTTSNDVIHLRLGKGKAFFMVIEPSQMGRVVKSIDYETGEEAILHNLATNAAFTVGRSQDCAIKMVHAYISRQHAEFFLDDEILVIKDLGSINGTYLYAENVHFDIDDYVEHHPVSQMNTSTTDATHETFGPKLGDFLKRYLEKKDHIS